jgi:hypothetical protein
MERLPNYNGFINEKKDLELYESFLTAVKKYAIKLALDPNVQRAMRDVVDAITGKTVDDAFAAVKNRLKKALGEPIDDVDDLPNWEPRQRLSSHEDSREFVEDYMSTGAVKKEAGDAPMNIQLNLNSDAKAIFGGTDEDLKIMAKKFLNEDSAFGPGMMFGIPGPGPKADTEGILSDPSKEKGISVEDMKNLPTFNEFVNEDAINEDASSAMAALTILMQAVMMSGPLVALGIRNGAFDDLRTPAEVIRDWRRDRIVSGAIDKLSKDPEIVEFLKLPWNKQRGKWQALVSTKLTDKEMKHINSISRDRVKSGKI